MPGWTGRIPHGMRLLKGLFLAESAKDQGIITRLVFLRSLSLVYLVAFLGLALEGPGLWGERGILPLSLYLKRMATQLSSPISRMTELPTLFWWRADQVTLSGAAWTGVILSSLSLLGTANALTMVILWGLYLSFVHIGQVFLSFGWDILLLETGFLAIFMQPLWRLVPRHPLSQPPVLTWILRWLLFRIYLGAGLIKVKSGGCWLDLSCLSYHFETQPLPNPLSWWIHQAPRWILQGGVVLNHLVELAVPFLIWGPRRWRQIGIVVMILFQVILILSGNLSFLNWLTIVIALGCLDDDFYRRVLGRWCPAHQVTSPPLGRLRPIVIVLLAMMILWKSWAPFKNLWEPRQIMNGSFDAWHLVNTYGAFGAVGETRPEIVLEGTDAPQLTETTLWREYEFKFKPGSLQRSLPIVAPYQPRLDWQIWFAAMSRYEREPWLISLVYRLLLASPEVTSLLAKDPFPPQGPMPRVTYIRAQLYRYQMTRLGDGAPGPWRRQLIGEYFPPIALTNPSLRPFLTGHGLLP